MKKFGRTKIAMILAALIVVMGALSLFVGAQSEPAEDPLADFDGANEYLGSYEDNLMGDEDFETNLEKAIATVRQSVKRYGTLWAMVPRCWPSVLPLSPRRSIPPCSWAFSPALSSTPTLTPLAL